jgi:RNA polymerase sigma factor (TIGR02999 family)
VRVSPDAWPVGVTALLERWSAGDRAAAERVLPLVYGELRRMAARQLRAERGPHTQATAIVHETYLRLTEHAGLTWPSRHHFFAFAAHLMRRILVDHARRRNRAKRGGLLRRVTLAEIEEHGELGLARATDLEALDEALTRLEALDARKAAVVELRFFSGMSIEETAAQLGVSVETVGREWRRARAWLYEALTTQGSSG